MADTSQPERQFFWNTYTHGLGRNLHPDNAGAMQWGPEYRDFHERAWAEARRVLCPGGLFVLNIKDHIRDGERVYVTDWHIGALESLGFLVEKHVKVPTPSFRFGKNWQARVEYESVIALRPEAL